MSNLFKKLFRKDNIKIGKQVTRTPNKITVDYFTMDYKLTSFVLAIVFVLLIILDIGGLANIDIFDYLLVAILCVGFYFGKDPSKD